MRLLVVTVVLFVAGCGSTPASTSPSTAEPAPSAVARGIATDQPCTRSVDSEPDVFDVPFQLHDLERMIPAAADIPGLVGFEDDMYVHGYQDNAELETVVPNAPSTCEGLERFGRVTGFGIGYARPDDTTHHVLVVVHLFGDELAAAAWPDTFFDSLAASAGKPDGPTSFTMADPPGLPDNTLVAEHVGPDGVRTWASTSRGPIVGWVVDLHPEGEPTVDISAAVRVLAEHVDATNSDATVGVRTGADAAHLLSSQLPLAAYGALGNGLAWDWWFGGCSDAVERGMIAGDQARVDAERFGRVSGCTAMYSPPGGGPTPDGTVRVFSSVSMYGDPQGASESISALIAENKGKGGVLFEVPRLGDEAIGQVTPVNAGDTRYTDTRVVLRRGIYVGTVALHSTAAHDASAELVELGTALDARMGELLEP